jgi:hypothetical protein
VPTDMSLLYLLLTRPHINRISVLVKEEDIYAETSFTSKEAFTAAPKTCFLFTRRRNLYRREMQIIKLKLLRPFQVCNLRWSEDIKFLFRYSQLFEKLFSRPRPSGPTDRPKS